MKLVWIVTGNTGEHSEWETWPVCAFMTEAEADAYAAVANDWLRDRSIHREDVHNPRNAPTRSVGLRERQEATRIPPAFDPKIRVDDTGAAYEVIGPIPIEGFAIDQSLIAAVDAADLKHAQFSAEHVAKGSVYTDWDDSECGIERTRVAFANHIIAQFRARNDAASAKIAARLRRKDA